MNKTLLVAALLALGAVTVCPAASAEHVTCQPTYEPVPVDCVLVEAASHPDRVPTCLWTTAPEDWSDCA